MIDTDKYEGQERNCASCNIGIVGEMTPCEGCGEYYCLDLEGKTGKLACQTLDGMCKDCHPKDENWKMNFGFEYDAGISLKIIEEQMDWREEE